MKMRELMQKSEQELVAVVLERRARIRVLRLGVHQGKIKNVKEVAAARKDIARVLTLQKSKKSSTNG